MQKFIFTATINALIKADAVFQPAPDRGADALNMRLTLPDQQSVGYEGRRDANGSFVFTTYDEYTAQEMEAELKSLNIEFDLKVYDGRGLRVNVLELLRTGWLVCAPKGQNTLRVMLPNDMNVSLKYRNDGTSLYAEYDGIDTSDTGEVRNGVWVLLKMHLSEAVVTYEVL